MMTRVLLFVTVTAAAVGLAHVPVHAGQDMSKTTWDGVYSAAQAQKGEAIYNDKCAKCHGPDGNGGDAPSLVGSEFAGDWDGLSVGQLFDRTRSSMPQDAPQSLSREETVQLMAYLLRQNRFPAGSADLSDRPEMLGTIKYVATKP